MRLHLWVLTKHGSDWSFRIEKKVATIESDTSLTLSVYVAPEKADKAEKSEATGDTSVMGGDTTFDIMGRIDQAAVFDKVRACALFLGAEVGAGRPLP